ncbi:hypothetical protein [Rheinheimera soli]|uniref:Mevalonate pyrophosphate decarboxylase n=1 Tax=Rheinheimera soli TaxID=443616 RepID=A0ABU1W0Y2_9GAMM|nr:hypothetical protein [Rheinheimera soli]MDR7121626.1 mevalonate pyrophosphate decarboxylase [Rheinheimera soli]
MRSLVTLVAVGLVSSAAFASEVSNQLTQCRAIQNDLKRLVCYDKIGSATFSHSVSSGTAAIEPRSTSTEQVQTLSSERFGVEHKGIAKTAASSMTAQVTAIQQSKTGLWTITLDNGQKWRQISSDGFIIREGDNIVINRGTLNSFLLSKIGTERQTKVSRLQD